MVHAPCHRVPSTFRPKVSVVRCPTIGPTGPMQTCPGFEFGIFWWATQHILWANLPCLIALNYLHNIRSLSPILFLNSELSIYCPLYFSCSISMPVHRSMISFKFALCIKVITPKSYGSILIFVLSLLSYTNVHVYDIFYSSPKYWSFDSYFIF